MPTYDYQCTAGYNFEKIHKMSESPRVKCPICGKPAARQISGGAGLVFKGSGFYITDYGKDGKLQFPRAKGCDTCGGSGYKGRVGLHELMVGTEPTKKLIQEHARVSQLFAQALQDGMLTLKMDGMEKVLQGVTDLKQVRAVCIK